MKQYLTLLFFLALGWTQVRATHTAGMDISYEYIWGGQYRVTVQLYRECSGTNYPNTLTLNATSSNCGSISTTLTRQLVLYSDLCHPTQCNGSGTTPDVEIHRYQGTITVPSFNNCTWRFSAEMCCRNSFATNMNSGGSYYTEAEVLHNTTIANNSPSFGLPVMIVCNNQLQQFSYQAIDPEGDSLVYELATPLNSHNNPLPYLSGYSATYPVVTTTGQFQLDNKTGQFSFTPSGVQYADFDVVISEYRNGVLISRIRRTQLLRVINCANQQPPTLQQVHVYNNGTRVAQGTQTDIAALPDSLVRFRLDYSDSNAGDSLYWDSLPSTLHQIYPTASVQVIPNANPSQLSLDIRLPASRMDSFWVTVRDNSCPLPMRTYTPIRIVRDSQLVEVQGFVYKDAHQNCTYDPYEYRTSNYQLRFVQNTDTFYATSNAQGYYSRFLDTGSYAIDLLTTATPINCPGLDSLHLTSSGGMVPLNFPVEGIQLVGQVRMDTGYNCVADPYEPLYTDYTLTASDGINTYQATPDSNGYYRFDLTAGSYTISINAHNPFLDFCSGTNLVTLTTSGIDTLHLPLPANQIPGRFFYDTNQNCAFDQEPIHHTYNVDITDGVTTFNITANYDSVYHFYLPLGLYTVIGNYNSNLAALCRPRRSFPMNRRGTQPMLDWAIPAVELSGTPYYDTNHNCLRDSNEQSLSSYELHIQSSVNPPVIERLSFTSSHHFYIAPGQYTLTLHDLSYRTAHVDPCFNNSRLIVPSGSGQPIQWDFAVQSDSMHLLFFADLNNNCIQDSGEVVLPSVNRMTFSELIPPYWGNFNFLQPINNVYSAFLPVSDYTIDPYNPSLPYTINCPSQRQFQVRPNQDTIRIATMPQISPYVSIHIGASILIQCATNTYHVHYQNHALTTRTGIQARLSFDPQFVVDNMSLPYQYDSITNHYWVTLLTMYPLGSGSFTVTGRLDTACTSALGQTYCAEAWIEPDSSFFANLAVLKVEQQCDSANHQFRIKNIGTQAMSQPEAYRILQNNQPYQQGTALQLGAGDSTAWVSVPNTGDVYRMEIDQDSTYLWSAQASATTTTCSSQPVVGITNLYSLNDREPYYSIDCQPGVRAFDPNDKQGFPNGYGSDHHIHRNTDIEYRLRFQNTGTYYAQNVVLIDTLSPHLIPQSIQLQSASHRYSWRLYGNVLEISFNNIMLPDSGRDMTGSQGFIDFRIQQQPNLPLGTRIENSAGIYFDANAPIYTNTTWHTIGENFIRVTDLPAVASEDEQVRVTAFPNPFQHSTTIRVEGAVGYKKLRLEVYNATGQLVHQSQNQNGVSTVVLYRNDLTPGIYFYRLVADDQLLHTGKLIAQ